jgi:hypothetical protein
MANDPPKFTPGELPPEVQKALDQLDWASPNSSEVLAIAIHEVTAAFEKAGFTRNESTYCAIAMFLGNPGIAPRP